MAENPEVVVPQNPTTETVTIPKEEWEQTKHKAEVSSQNFERLKKAEEEKAELEAALQGLNQDPSGEGNVRLKELEATVGTLKEEISKARVIELNPQLKEVWSDFEQFRADPENKGMNLNTAAKAFLVEKGLITPQRKGLESVTGGSKVPQPSGMTTQEIEDLRKNNYKEYQKRLMSGEIKFS